MKSIRALVGGLMLFVVVACTNTPAASQPLPSGGVVAPVCVSFVVLLDRIHDFRSLDVSSVGVEDYRLAGRQVVAAYREFETQIKNAVEDTAAVEALRVASENLSAAANSLPATATPAEAQAALADEVAAFETALLAINSSSLHCPIPSPAP
jgi:hypothetical protein